MSASSQRKTSNTAPIPISNRQITSAYAEMAERYVAEGWTPYLLTFMFQQLRGSPSAVARQMERELERVYARFVSRVVRYPRSPANIGSLPVWICSPDYPVFKHAKQRLRDVTINDGRHLHGVMFEPPWSRLRETVDEHFAALQHLYVGRGSCLTGIDAVPITHDLAYVVRYAEKALRRGVIGSDEMILLPRSWNELPSRTHTLELPK